MNKNDNRNNTLNKFLFILCIVTFVVGVFVSKNIGGMPIKEQLKILAFSFIPFIIYLILLFITYVFKNRKIVTSIIKNISLILTGIVFLYYLIIISILPNMEILKPVVDSKEIRINYISGNDKDKMKKRFKYKNSDGKEYVVYEDCYDCLEVRVGNRGNSIRKMLDSKLVTMDDIFIQLEKEAESNHIYKEIYKDGGTILYKGSNYAILRCNTIDGNKDIYISDTNLEYESSYCK